VTPFQAAVDRFMLAEKRVVGEFEWGDSAYMDEVAGYWLLQAGGETGPHRLQVVARPFTAWKGYAVMVMYDWMGRLYPVARINADTAGHEHLNHPPWPPGISPSVRGNRVYRWQDNRLYFAPSMIGLPYARQMPERALTLHSAIRLLAAEHAIVLADTPLPDYPSPNRLL
jgi:hypothetical protein